MMASRNDFDDFFGDDDEAPVVDTRADGRLYRVPLTRLAANLVNPRTDFGTEDQLLDLGKSLARQQNQPCPVVSKNAYLKLWPEHKDRIKDVDYVLVSGERRFRAAAAAGLAGLDCVANDAFAATRKAFLEAVVSENVDRQNFDPIEEAFAVQALVEAFGGNRQVAHHFERSDGWVTQRVCLTHLSPELQQQVRDKELSLELARRVGQKAKKNKWGNEEQQQWLKEELERLAAERDAGKPGPPIPAPAEPRPSAVPSPSTTAEGLTGGSGGAGASFTAVKPERSQTAPAAAEPVVQNAVAKPTPATPPEAEKSAAFPPEPETQDAPPTAGDGVPGQREQQGDERPKYDRAWNEPGTLNGLIRERTESPNFFALVGLLLEQGAERDEQELRKVLSGYIAST